ncbi:MAG: ATP-grasp domain-containing protein [Verrucomicrobiota bacterium]
MKPIRIAISGMHRGENPQPGASIAAAIRHAWPEAFIVGLVYNAFESGVYVAGGPDVCHAMPYPTAGLGPYLTRLAEVRAATPFDWFIPTLDAEIVMLAGASKELAELGIGVRLPDPAVLARCGKAQLPELADHCGVATPATAVARDVGEALEHAEAAGYPVFLKGPFYDAVLVHNPAGLAAAGAAILADWGPPLLVQEPLLGTEFNVMGLGDGKGGLLGSCALRKLIISDKGKGNGSVVVRDLRLDEITRRVMAATHWSGPFELEFIRDQRDDGYRLIEINPRFPAWVGFPAQLGANFPAAWVEWMLQRPVRLLPQPAPGRFFLRHQIEVTGDMGQISALLDALPNSINHNLTSNSISA